jgi:hypothetical protein
MIWVLSLKTSKFFFLLKLFVIQALHFVVAAIRSGNAAVLMPVLLRLLQPVLALQVVLLLLTWMLWNLLKNFMEF